MRVSACVAGRLFASFFTLTCLVAIGCGGGHKTSSSYSIAISVTSGTIAVGTTNQLHATETNSAGISVDVTRSVSWSSSNTAIATVSSTGLLTGVGMGTATISANLNSTTATQAVTIAAAVSKLAISPAGISLFTGGTQQFSVTATYSDGSTGDLTNSATWSVTPESVATISSAGLLTAVGAGSFTVTAASGSVTATASGIVSAPEVTSIAISPANATLAFGGTQQFTAVAMYSDGSSASVTSAVTWSVTPASVAKISPSGLLKAVGAGSFAVTAKSGVVTGAVTGVVKNATLTSIAVSPTSTTLAAGSAQQYTATATYSDGSRVSLTNSASWSVTPSSVATINSSGLLMAVGAGSFSVTAATGSATGSAAGTVTSATLKSISISPASAVLFNGATQQYTATGTYSDGSVGNVSSSTTWSVMPSSVATISTGGLLTTVGAGSFTVTATSGSAMGGSVVSSATGTVSSPTLTSISVSPATVTLAKGATQQYTATGTYNDHSTKDLTASVTWSSDNATALAIDAAGLATAGTVSASTMVTISAQSGTLTGSATATVTASAMMTSMEVRPTSSSIASGTAEAHTALAFYSDGTQKDVSNLATWSVTPSSLNKPSRRKLESAGATSGKAGVRANDSGSDVLTVDQDGIDYANQAGAANVQASLGSLQAASVVLVSAATVNLIGITSPALVLPVSAKQQFTLNGWFTDGSTQDLSLTANWQSSDSNIASVDSKGVVTAIRAGTFTVTANFGGLTATKVAQVVAADLVGTTIRAEYPVVGKGASEQLAVVGTFSDGSIQDLTPLATWSSSNSAVVSVDSAGFLQAIAPGRIQVAATVNGVGSEITILVADADIASFQVLPVNPSFALGTSLQFTALAAFTNGGQADLSDAVEWVSSDPTVLTINSQGLAKSFGVGTTTVTASLGGVSQISSVITVTSATITAMQLSPTSATIAKTTHQQYRATGWFSDGSIEDLDNDVAWSTSDAAIASVDNDGTVLGLRPGTAMVSALFSGISVSAPLTVTDATLVSTVLAPGNTELPVGMQLPFTLMGNFSDGSTQDLSADAIWQSPTPSIVFATATGSGVGLSPGIGTLSAVLGNFSSSTQVNVTDASLNGIALSPVAPVIRVGGSQQMVATGTFSDGYQQSLYLNAVFHADNNKIVNIGAAALAVGTAVGTTQITATFRGMTASTTSFTVQSGTLTSITLGPSNPTVDSGGSEQLTATGVYADGTTGDLTGKVTWTSSDPSVLAIDSNGVATAYAVTTATTVTVTATLGSITQSFNVTISPANGANVTALTITPMHATVAPGATQQYVAMATYADGQTRDVSTSVSWSSSNLLAAAISSNGLATGVATGITRIRGQIDGMWTSVSLTVSPVTQPGATVTSISVTPSIAAISAGATEQFTARASFSDGSLQDVTNTATWSSSNASAATVNSSGLATGVAAGASTIGATLSGVTGSATLTVSTATTKTLTAKCDPCLHLHHTEPRAHLCQGHDAAIHGDR
jgi:uncharacterized protein YjdB